MSTEIPDQQGSEILRAHTFVAWLEDRPGVLARVVGLFRRRNENIISLNVGRTHDPGVSRMTVVIEADDAAARRFEANLYKLVNVLGVEDITDLQTVRRDLALLKVSVEESRRAEAMRLCEVFRARVIDVAPGGFIAEITGAQDKIQGLVDVLSPFGVAEMVQTGAIAMTRVSEGPSAIARHLAEG